MHLWWHNCSLGLLGIHKHILTVPNVLQTWMLLSIQSKQPESWGSEGRKVFLLGQPLRYHVAQLAMFAVDPKHHLSLSAFTHYHPQLWLLVSEWYFDVAKVRSLWAAKGGEGACNFGAIEVIINDVVALLRINILCHTYLTCISLHVFMAAAQWRNRSDGGASRGNNASCTTFKERFRDSLWEHAATGSRPLPVKKAIPQCHSSAVVRMLLSLNIASY